jgi:putative DNA primase/helicase
MTDTTDAQQIATFGDIKAAAELREVPLRQPTRAQRMIMNCLVCGGEFCVTVQSKRSFVFVTCDNGCAPIEIMHALKVDGLLRAPRSADDLAAKHGNQVRIAYLFAEMFAHMFIHVFGLGWFWWSGKRWVEDRGDKRVTEYLLRALRRALTDSLNDPELRKAVGQCETANSIAGTLRIAATLPEFRIEAEELDADPYLLNFANGTLDLHELARRPHNPDDLITKVTEAAYDENAVGATWEAFLAEVLPNEAVRECFRRLIGMSLIGRQVEHVLPLLTGVGANGKSTAVDAILYALGDYAMAADPNLLTEGKTSSMGLVDLMRRRLAAINETNKDARIADATAKQVTGGDRMKARKLYCDWVEFTPSHTLLMVTNHPPKVSGDDEAMWRRLLVFPFDVVVPKDKRDGTLPDKLKLDAEGILAWAVQGLADYQAEGLNPPDEVLLATADYRAKSDHVGQFITDQCVTGSPALKVSAKALHEAWQRWAAAEDCDPLGRNTFQEVVAKRPGIRATKSGGQKFFEGVRLRTAADGD